MKNLILLITVILISIASFGQKVETKYFDKKGNIANPKKAKFKQTTTTYDDGKIEKTSHKIKGNILMSKSQYLDGKPVGIWEAYDKNGKLESKRDFNKLVYAKPIIADKNKEEEKDSLEGHVFVPPTYGSEKDRLNYLRNKLHYPEEAKESGAQGTIYLTFVITKQGDVSNIEILRGVNPFLDYEAYRVISEMGKWKPATVDGELIDIQLNMPVRFILAD